MRFTFPGMQQACGPAEVYSKTAPAFASSKLQLPLGWVVFNQREAPWFRFGQCKPGTAVGDLADSQLRKAFECRKETTL